MQDILLESNPLLCSPNALWCPFCTQTSDLSYPISSLVSHLVPLRSVLNSLSLPVAADHIKGWTQLLVTSLTCSLELTSSRAAARAGHSDNWNKSGRSRTTFQGPSAELGQAKLHCLHIPRKRTYSHISSALLSLWLWDSRRGAARGGKQGD